MRRVLESCWFADQGLRIPYEEFMLGTPLPARTMYCHFGVVEFIHARPGVVTLRWAVRHVIPEALSAARHHLEALMRRIDVHKHLIILDFRWGAWCTESTTSLQQALERIDELQCFRTAIPFTKASMTALPIPETREAANATGFALDLFYQKDGNVTFEDVKDVGLDAHVLTYTLDDSDYFHFDHVGKNAIAISYFGREWAKRAKGMPVDRSQPDYEFVERVCAPYAEVLNSGTPRVDNIVTPLRRVDARNVWCNYHRAVLPFTDSRGERRILSIATPKRDVGACHFMSAC